MLYELERTWSSLHSIINLHLNKFPTCSGLGMYCIYSSCNLISSRYEAFWPHVHPAGLLPRPEGSDHVPLCTTAHVPGAASAKRRCVLRINIWMVLVATRSLKKKKKSFLLVKNCFSCSTFSFLFASFPSPLSLCFSQVFRIH